MGLFKFNTSKQTANYQTYSSAFRSVGGENLSLPNIDPAYNTGGAVMFGTDNLYPQKLDQMFYTSPIHGSIVNYQINAAIGGGYTFKNTEDTKQNIEAKVFEKTFKLNRIAEIARDLKIHERVYFLLKVKNGKPISSRRLSPETIRHADFNERGEIDRVFYNKDWSRGISRQEYKVFHPDNKDEFQVYMYQSFNDKVYSLPSYSSALNWIYLDGEMSYLQKSNIQNSIFPAFSLLFPFMPKSDEEKQELKTSIERNKGAKNASKLFVYHAQSREQLPEIKALPTNQNDRLFMQTSKDIKENIAFSHSINPSIVGVKYAGSLGNAQELEMSYSAWEKNIVMPFRKELENIVNDLAFICGVVAEFKFNEFKIIGEVLSEDNGNEVVKTLNAMSPLLATKVLENLTPNEIRDLAKLKAVDEGEEIVALTPQQTQQNF